MSLPTRVAAAQSTSTNGVDPVTTSALAATQAAGDLVVVAIETLDAAVPSFVLRNTAGSGTFTTEDGETIAASSDGTVVYKDGSSSSVAYDYHTGDSTNGFVYFWSIKISSVSAPSAPLVAKVTYGGTASGSNRRTYFASVHPGSGDTIPARASRLLCTYSTTGGAGGSGSYSVARASGSTPTVPAYLVMGIRAGGTSSTVTVDTDNDTTFETTTLAGNGDGRVTSATSGNSFWADGYWDTSGAHLPGDPIKINFANTPGTAKTFAAVIYTTQGAVTVTGTASGAGGGTGAVTGVREVMGTASGLGGGTGTVSATQVYIGGALGLGGGTGTATGIATVIGTASGLGGGTGSAASQSVVLGTALGLGGGLGTGSGALTVVPPERSLVLNHNTLAVLEG